MNIVKKILIGIGAIPLLLIASWTLFWLFVALSAAISYSPNWLATYKLERETDKTDDKVILEVSCDDVGFAVTQWDSVNSGISALGDDPNVRPQIVERQRLTAYQNGKVLFDVPTRGKIWASINLDTHLSSLDNDVLYFVLDDTEFIKMNGGGYLGDILQFESSSGIDRNQIEELAKCYKKNKPELDAAWQENVSVFTLRYNAKSTGKKIYI